MTTKEKLAEEYANDGNNDSIGRAYLAGYSAAEERSKVLKEAILNAIDYLVDEWNRGTRSPQLLDELKCLEDSLAEYRGES